MPLRILIAPDKFKGTLTACDAASAIARGWRKIRPRDKLTLLPISDGGDGFGEIVSGLLRAKSQAVRTMDAAHRPCKVEWWWNVKSKTAVIASARVIGLAMLPPKKFHPFELDTFGLGTVIHAASKNGARKILLGIGGSATNDGGFGLARALGWNFFDSSGEIILRWTDLHKLASVSAPTKSFCRAKIMVAVDVQNPLLGALGATRVYGPQKGLKPFELATAEKNLIKLARFGVPALAGPDRLKAGLQTVPGTGAAGGLGFGLLAFAGAKLEPGFDLFAHLASLNSHLRSADLVIAGCRA